MVNKVGKIWDEIQVYEDQYMEDNKVLRGRKDNKASFIVANPKTAKFIIQGFIKQVRKEKLEKINVTTLSINTL